MFDDLTKPNNFRGKLVKLFGECLNFLEFLFGLIFKFYGFFFYFPESLSLFDEVIVFDDLHLLLANLGVKYFLQLNNVHEVSIDLYFKLFLGNKVLRPFKFCQLQEYFLFLLYCNC
jgi:hypothetical protein